MSEVQVLHGNEEWSNSTPHTQVFWATHNNDETRMRFKNKSFISFTYGGKFIEDFDLIVVNKNKSRMDGSIYGQFDSNTSSLEVADGQLYWGTHFTNNKLNIYLATDHMTEEHFEQFKQWFKPGPPKELILAEKPNRAIMARINTVPQYHLLPFEEKVKKKLANIEFEISTTVYKGEIDLEFIMDDPFWYSIYNVLPSFDNEINGNENVKTLKINSSNNAYNNSLVSNQDYLKVILEDGVPTREMIRCDHLITGDAITDILEDPKAGYYDNNQSAVVGDRLKSDIITIDSSNNKNYIYYPGTAPAPTLLSFNLQPEVDEETGYIKAPLNSIYKEATNTEVNEYNTLKIGNTEFKFTTPSVYTGYNQALKIISSDEVKNGGMSIIDLRILLTEGIGEYYSRSWALGVANYLFVCGICVDKSTSQIQEGFDENFKKWMKYFLFIENSESSESDISYYDGYPKNNHKHQFEVKNNNEDNELQSNMSIGKYYFNSKTGEAAGKFKIRAFKTDAQFTWDQINITADSSVTIFLQTNHLSSIADLTENKSIIIENDQKIEGHTLKTINNNLNNVKWVFNHPLKMIVQTSTNTEPITVTSLFDQSEPIEITENVGDMIYNNFLYLNEQNWYNENGIITDECCSEVITDYPTGLNNFNLEYKYMYL